jgi:excisionase family DNA binding protein
MDGATEFLTTAQVATALGMSQKTVWTWARTNKIDHWFTPGGQIRIPASEVDRIKSTGRHPNQPQTAVTR